MNARGELRAARQERRRERVAAREGRRGRRGQADAAGDDAGHGAAPQMAQDDHNEANQQMPPPVARQRRNNKSDAARLANKMQEKTDAKTKMYQKMTEREIIIQQLYAPQVAEYLISDGFTKGELSHEEMVNYFDKDDLLASYITDTKANFLKLDQELSEDHQITTEKLYSSVFSNANDFLALFKDVSKASDLVEALKANVQGTKAAISSISKITCSNVGNVNPRATDTKKKGDASARYAGGDGSSSKNLNSILTRPRPSLVSHRLYLSGGAGLDYDPSYAMSVSQFGVSEEEVENATKSMRVDTEGNSNPNGTAAEAQESKDNDVCQSTTRALNVSSLLQWSRLIAGRNPAGSAELNTSKKATNTEEKKKPSSTVEGRKDDVEAFADIVKEEVDQLLADRRHTEAATLLRSMTTDATTKGCLGLLLDLEAALVSAVTNKISNIPITPMYFESVHIPLVQLLLQFGRTKTGTFTFLLLQNRWLDNALVKLQSQVNPRNASQITVDYLAKAIRMVLQRQRTLWYSLEELQKEKEKEQAAKAKQTASKRDTANDKKDSKLSKMIPPNSAALLWVRYNIQRFAREVLSTHLLSYGTGTDGGDPSRVCRAAGLVADSMRVLRTLTKEGFPGCDTLTLRQLSPSMVVLKDDFTQLTCVKMNNTGRAMAELLIASCLLAQKDTAAPKYNPVSSEYAARKANLLCQSVLKSVTPLPACAHTWLIQLGLSPALSTMFERNFQSTMMYMNQCKGVEPLLAASGGKSLLSPDVYRFLRLTNGYSMNCCVLVSSIIKYVAAMTGGEQLPRMPDTATTAAAATTPAPEPKKSTGKGKAEEKAPPADKDAVNDEGTVFYKQLECGSFLLSNALITESMDATLQNLFVGFFLTTLREQHAILRFATSDPQLQKNVSLYGQVDKLTSAPPLCDAASSPGWIFDGMLSLLNDVLHASVWVSYIARGGAMAHLLTSSTLLFRTQHVEELRLLTPTLVQEWMTVALVSGFRLSLGVDLLLGDIPDPQEVKTESTTASAIRCRTVPTFSGEFTPTLPPVVEAFAATSINVVAVPVDHRSGEGEEMQRATSTALLSEEEHHHNKTLQSLTGQVNQKRLFPVLMSFLDRPFVTRKGYRAHLYCNATGSFPPTRTTDAQGIEHLTEAWGVRSALPRYPEFPLGHVKSNKEESFLFHWVVQITLQLLTTFQERLLCPSYLENRLSSEAQTPNVEKEVIKGCVSPQEDSALASLCGGGGYYVTAVATLQFLVIRILRDALCVPATWTAVYGCSLEQWKNDETALKQIIFFFSAFLRFWSPLFTGGVRVPLDTSNTSSRASKGKPFTASRHTVSEVNVDGLASLSLLEWFTCSNILEQDSAKSTAAATAMGPIGATETPAKVATAVEDLLNRKGFLPVSPPVAVAPNKGGSVARDNAKSWRRPSEQTKERDAAVEAVTGTGSGASPVLSASSAAAVQAMLQATTNYIPDTLLKVVLHFFEEVLQEPKAISGITSEVTRGRVDRVFESINLIAYSSAEEPDSEEEVVNPADGRKLTLSDLRELLVYYLDPVL